VNEGAGVLMVLTTSKQTSRMDLHLGGLRKQILKLLGETCSGVKLFKSIGHSHVSCHSEGLVVGHGSKGSFASRLYPREKTSVLISLFRA
jgi:hypothetical protein